MLRLNYKGQKNFSAVTDGGNLRSARYPVRGKPPRAPKCCLPRFSPPYAPTGRSRELIFFLILLAILKNANINLFILMSTYQR